MNISAIICARNEATYLVSIVPYLESEGVELVLIDNESTDGTQDLFTKNKYSNIVDVVHLPYSGVFDLTEQLQVKSEVVERLGADWIIHQDADEILQSPTNWGGLRRNIEAADAEGFNVLNFNELVMLPVDPGVDDILNNNANYYFFEPRPLRLMRAWKRSALLRNGGSGGHILEGEDIAIYPQRMILKHFIVRSQAHALKKFLDRKFSSTDINRGWHRNRRNFSVDNLSIPIHGPWLHRLPNPKDTPAVLPPAAKKHFWEWPRTDDGGSISNETRL